MTPEQTELISRARQLRIQAEAAESVFHDAVRDARAGGLSLREIAAALGVSHQTVSNIVKRR